MAHEQVSAYPTPEQATRWRDRAGEMGMGMSEFVASMVEAGLKGFEAYAPADPAVDTTADDLRAQLQAERGESDRLRAELRQANDRLTGTDMGDIVRTVHETPGVTYDDLLEHVRAETPTRVEAHLTALDGDLIRGAFAEDETVRYFPAEVSAEQATRWDISTPTNDRGGHATGWR